MCACAPDICRLPAPLGAALGSEISGARYKDREESRSCKCRVEPSPGVKRPSYFGGRGWREAGREAEGSLPGSSGHAVWVVRAARALA